MKSFIIHKSIMQLLLVFSICMTFANCAKKLTPEERKIRLKTIVTSEDCKELANNALKTVLNNLREVRYDNVLFDVLEDIYYYDKENNLYIQVIVSGHAKGIYNGKDSTYLFVVSGKIPETHADEKAFDEDGYDLSLKSGDGFFIYNNREDVDSLNKSILETHKQVEEMAKKDFMIGKTKVQFEGREGNALIYSSSRELTEDEIADAVQHKIESEGTNMIQFKYRGERYADYVYKTQCIIFVKYQDRIYKIVGGNPVKL